MRLRLRLVLAAIFAACVVLYVLYWLTTPLAVEFERNCATVGQLAKATLAENFGAISDACDRSNAAELWDSLRQIIAEQLGVRPGDLKRETSFVKDLKID
jgi:hypothetical protein